jgi:tight adherence protein C
MRNYLVITALLLIPVFLLLVEDVAWEKSSIRYIKKIGDRTDVREKLQELGYNDEKSYENFRYRQLILIFIALALGIAVSIFLDLSIAALSLFALISIFAVILLTEQKLNREVSVHRESIEEDFPSIIEALTLSLSAGESPLTSMQRISMRGQGALVNEFSAVIEEVKNGHPYASALDSMGRRVKSIAVRRFIDALVIALTRGAPLVEVLHSHAREARDYQRNRVLSAASKAELTMMIPVVFLILPISILFALWPSLANLNLFAQG